MATLDQLVVELILDVKKFDTELSGIANRLGKIEKSGVDTNKSLQSHTDKTTEAFGLLQKRLLSVSAIFLGGMGVKEFSEKIITLTSQIGYMSQQMGQSVGTLGTWMNAGKAVGGTGADIAASMQHIASEIYRFRITGDSSLIPFLNRMGISTLNANHKLRDMNLILNDMNKWAQNKDAGFAAEWFREMGMSFGMINMLLMKRGDFIKLREYMKQLAPTKEETERAQAFIMAWGKMEAIANASGRAVLGQLVTPLSNLWEIIKQLFPQIKMIEGQNPGAIVKWLVGESSELGKFIKDINEFINSIQRLVNKTQEIKKSIGGWDEKGEFHPGPLTEQKPPFTVPKFLKKSPQPFPPEFNKPPTLLEITPLFKDPSVAPPLQAPKPAPGMHFKPYGEKPDIGLSDPGIENKQKSLWQKFWDKFLDSGNESLNHPMSYRSSGSGGLGGLVAASMLGPAGSGSQSLLMYAGLSQLMGGGGGGGGGSGGDGSGTASANFPGGGGSGRGDRGGGGGGAASANFPGANPIPGAAANGLAGQRGTYGSANFFGSGKAAAMGIKGGVGANLVSITTAGGHRITVNQEAAPHFKAFLEELEQSGYKIKQLGSFNARQKRGGRGWSEHAYGNAIDINENANAQYSSKNDLPPNIADIAAKYGLTWGGTWSPRYRDPMHFEWTGLPNVGDKGPSSQQRLASAAPGSREEAFTIIKAAAIQAGSPNPDMTAAIAMHESNYLKRQGVFGASGGTNPFGQTGVGSAGYVIGRDGQKHKVYNNLAEAVADHIRKWGKYYSNNAAETLRNLVRHGYNTANPGWAPEIADINRRMAGLPVPSTSGSASSGATSTSGSPEAAVDQPGGFIDKITTALREGEHKVAAENMGGAISKARAAMQEAAKNNVPLPPVPRSRPAGMGLGRGMEVGKGAWESERAKQEDRDRERRIRLGIDEANWERQENARVAGHFGHPSSPGTPIPRPRPGHREQYGPPIPKGRDLHHGEYGPPMPDTRGRGEHRHLTHPNSHLITAGYYNHNVSSHVATNNTHSQTHIGSINVHSQPGMDAYGIARDLGPAIERAKFAFQADYSLT